MRKKNKEEEIKRRF